MSSPIDAAWEACRRWAAADSRRACVHIAPRRIKLMVDWVQVAAVAVPGDGPREASVPACVIAVADGREFEMSSVDLACRPPGTDAGAYVGQWLDRALAGAAL